MKGRKCFKWEVTHKEWLGSNHMDEWAKISNCICRL